MTDTNFDTNPEQQRETLGNELYVDPANLSGFCNFQQPLELCRHRLLISRFQVRVLGGSLKKCLQIAGKQTSLVRYQGRFTPVSTPTRYPKASSIALAVPLSMPGSTCE